MKLFLFILNFALLFILGFRAIHLNIYSNTFHAPFMAIGSLVLGAVLGYFIAKKNDDVVEEEVLTIDSDEFEKYKLYATCIVGSMIAVFILSFNMNYLLSFSPKKNEMTLVKEVIPQYSARGGIIIGEEIKASSYNIFIEKNGKSERVRNATFENPDLVHDETLPLTFRTGLFGFECYYPNN
jgi:hypothetical protein